MGNAKYYLLTIGDSGYSSMMAVFNAAHHLTWPSNNLSVFPNLAGTQAIVKVDWGTATPSMGDNLEIPLQRAQELLGSDAWVPDFL